MQPICFIDQSESLPPASPASLISSLGVDIGEAAQSASSKLSSIIGKAHQFHGMTTLSFP